MRLSEMKGVDKKTYEDKSVEEQYNDLKNSSKDELFEKLSKEILSQKKNGTFDYDALVNAVGKMKAFLPEQTYKNMIEILEKFK